MFVVLFYPRFMSQIYSVLTKTLDVKPNPFFSSKLKIIFIITGDNAVV